MGMKMGLSSSTEEEGSTARRDAGNPNPYVFKLRSSKQIGQYFLAEVIYPGCTNFEGSKILVMNIDPEKMLKLDPHFTEGGYIVARFAPTDQGRTMAELLLSQLA
jgi:hypothetical protein